MANDDDKRPIDQSVTSHNQSGGITAHAVTIQVQQRNLTSEAKAIIAAELRRSAPGSLGIMFGPGVGDAGALMDDFIAAFAAGGWRIGATGQVIGAPHRGIAVCVRSPVGEAALQALVKAGIPLGRINRPPPMPAPPPGQPHIGPQMQDVELEIGLG
jgi:hypothetical protein